MGAAQAYQSLATAQKTAFGAPAYSRWVNRPLGRVLAVAAYRAGMSPNQVTLVSAAFTASGIACIAALPPSFSLGLAVTVLLALGYALDSADGQLARLTGLGRPSGEWLDHTVDMAKICTLQGAILLSWFQWGRPGLETSAGLLLLPLAFLTVNVLAFFGWLLSDLLIRVARARTPGAPVPDRGPATILRSLLRTPSDYGLMLLSFLLWSTTVYAYWYTALLAANALILALALPTWFGQVRRAEAPAEHAATGVAP